MSHMKELDIRIRSGGDDAVAAACELAGIAKERRGYEEMKNATGDITDIVTVLRGVGFAAVPPSAGESASLLHYCVTHAADEIERLREERRWIPVSERLPEEDQDVVVHTEDGTHVAAIDEDGVWYPSHGDGWMFPIVSHWMPLPSPPEVTP